MPFSVTSKDEYDEIFTALKNPIRRQILLYVEEKGEVTFSKIQNAVGIDDTGLMSYHLKELIPLVEQSERGKYRLSEVGQTTIQLFHKVEGNKQHLSKSVENEIERYIGKVFFLIVLFSVTLFGITSFDILIAVEGIVRNYSVTYLLGMFSASLLVLIVSSILFVVYDTNYYRPKTLKTQIVHAALFAGGLAVLSIILSFRYTILAQDSHLRTRLITKTL